MPYQPSPSLDKLELHTPQRPLLDSLGQRQPTQEVAQVGGVIEVLLVFSKALKIKYLPTSINTSGAPPIPTPMAVSRRYVRIPRRTGYCVQNNQLPLRVLYESVGKVGEVELVRKRRGCGTINQGC